MVSKRMDLEPAAHIGQLRADYRAGNFRPATAMFLDIMIVLRPLVGAIQ